MVEHMIVRVVEGSPNVRLNTLGIIEKLDNSDKGSTPAYKEITDVETLINEINRLGRNNHKKNWGPTDALINEYLDQVVVEDDIKDLLPTKKEGNSFLPSAKTWSRYRLAKNKPENYLNKVDSILKGTKQAYKNGPCSLFKIMEAGNITEALDLFKVQIIELTKGQLNAFHQMKKESISVKFDLDKVIDDYQHLLDHFARFEIPHRDNEANRYKHYHKTFFSLRRLPKWGISNNSFTLKGNEMGRNILAHSDSFATYTGKDACCLWLALAFISAKYFADYKFLKDTYKFKDILNAIEFYHSIPARLWFEENKEPESPIIIEFIEAQTR